MRRRRRRLRGKPSRLPWTRATGGRTCTRRCGKRTQSGLGGVPRTACSSGIGALTWSSEAVRTPMRPGCQRSRRRIGSSSATGGNATRACRVALGSDPGPLGDVMARLVAARRPRCEDGRPRQRAISPRRGAHRRWFDVHRAGIRRCPCGSSLRCRRPRGALRSAMNGALKSGTLLTRCEWLMPLRPGPLPIAFRVRAMTGAPNGTRWTRWMRWSRGSRRPSGTRPDNRRAGETPRSDGCAVCGGTGSRPWQAGEPLAWIRAVEVSANAALPFEGCTPPGGPQRRSSAEVTTGRPAPDAPARSGARRAPRRSTRRTRTARPRPSGAGCRRRASPEESAPPAALHGLTEREREVLDLLAVGRTYGEIARTLMISEKTVSTHVSHLLAKTGTPNRVELARLVHRLGADGMTADRSRVSASGCLGRGRCRRHDVGRHGPLEAQHHERHRRRGERGEHHVHADREHGKAVARLVEPDRDLHELDGEQRRGPSRAWAASGAMRRRRARWSAPGARTRATRARARAVRSRIRCGRPRRRPSAGPSRW